MRLTRRELEERAAAYVETIAEPPTAELIAAAAVVLELERLTDDERRRVIAWVRDRFGA